MGAIKYSALAVLALTACLPPTRPRPGYGQGYGSEDVQYVTKAVFDESEAARYEVRGTGVVSGQAFMKTRGGDVKYGAGNEVALFPDTAYMRERLQFQKFDAELETAPQWMLAGTIRKRVPPMDPRAARSVRTAIADGEGRFRFEGLPAGRYIAACTIMWEVPTRGKTGGVASKTFDVTDGGSVSVILTD